MTPGILFGYDPHSMKGILLGLAIAACIVGGCASDTVLAPPTLVPVSPELRSAPAQLLFGGATVHLDTYLWRDFQPITPPDGKPLIASLRVVSVGGAAIPTTLQADSAWIVNGDVAWASAVVQEQPRSDPSSFQVVAREGPKWGPGIDVDVVLQLRDATGQAFLLGASGQLMHRTE